MYLHPEPGYLSVLCGLLGDFCQLVKSLVVAEEVGNGTGSTNEQILTYGGMEQYLTTVG